MIDDRWFQPRGDCTDLRLGDEVVELIEGVLPRVLIVSAVRDSMFLATEIEADLRNGVWFDRDTGVALVLHGRGEPSSCVTAKRREL